MSEPTHAFPSAEETTQHPAYPSAIWKLQPHSSGHLRVAKERGRGGPFNLYWEVHGDGPTKLVLIMGLAGTLTSWQIQTHHFGHLHGNEYSVLVLDNRGIGRSDKPLGRYTTSAMARDVLETADHIGWTEERQLNIMAISLGGMVAQELACLAPRRVQSLSLLCTSASVQTWGGNTTMRDCIALFRPKSDDEAIRDTAARLFPLDFLRAPDLLVVPESSSFSTPRCAPAGTPDGAYLRFDSNFQRFQAQELHKRRCAHGGFSRLGFWCQILAVAGHHKSPEQLRAMADGVGRRRILVLHGVEDAMIDVADGRRLIRLLEPGAALVVEGMGHAPIFERSSWFNALLEHHLAVWSAL